MRRVLPLLLLLAVVNRAPAAGLLVPVEKDVPPLAMLNHNVTITINDQVAVTRVEQTFRNHTDRNLEATYLFPVPRGASVRKFSMWIGDREVPGEMVEARSARDIYTSVVQQSKDPGLLEQMNNDLLRLKVGRVPAHGEQKIMVSFTAVATADNGLVEYLYPLKTSGKAVATLEKFSITAELKSQHPLTNIYSPTHAITVSRANDREARVSFAKDAALLDRDFQLYYSAAGKDVGLTTLIHRPSPSNDGHFMLLISPREELAKEQQAPRDMVFVLDTSGSMRGQRIIQARNALKYCVSNLNPKDRFAILHFATAVNSWAPRLQNATTDNIAQAKKWVDQLEATGGTAINDALLAALDLRPQAEEGRTFNIVFFTDGRATIGETNEDRIKKNVLARNTASTRIFTFGVGDDVNAALLDALADESRALSTYVRENEDIEARVSGLYSKVSNPVLTNLKLEVGEGVRINETYPPQLPDLFHGTQLVILGRYSGQGHVAVTLTGKVGKDAKKFVYETNFAAKTPEDRTFVEDLWARRKVGYLLDQIRANGEKKELKDEVVVLAKRYGITTPYTSYLIVPDDVMAPKVANSPKAVPPADRKPDVRFNAVTPQAKPEPTSALKPQGGFQGGFGGFGGSTGGPGPGLPGQIGGGIPAGPVALAPVNPVKGDKQKTVNELLRDLDTTRNGDGVFGERGAVTQKQLQQLAEDKGKKKDLKGEPGRETPGQSSSNPTRTSELLPRTTDYEKEVVTDALAQLKTLERAREALSQKRHQEIQGGQLGVDFAQQNNYLRSQKQITNSAVRRLQNRNAVEVGGVWIDEAFNSKLRIVTIKALSKAYFRLLELQPQVKEVFALGNHLVWVTPSGVALVVDTTDGRAEMSDAELNALFVVPSTPAKKAAPPAQ